MKGVIELDVTLRNLNNCSYPKARDGRRDSPRVQNLQGIKEFPFKSKRRGSE